MGELLATASNPFPVQLVASIVCSIAIGIYALSQGNGSEDDDDSGSGGGGSGGIMQPVAMGTR